MNLGQNLPPSATGEQQRPPVNLSELEQARFEAYVNAEPSERAVSYSSSLSRTAVSSAVESVGQSRGYTPEQQMEFAKIAEQVGKLIVRYRVDSIDSKIEVDEIKQRISQDKLAAAA